MRFKAHISVLVIYFEEFETLQVLAFIYHPSNIAKITFYCQKPCVILRFNKQPHELKQELRYTSSYKHLFKHVRDY